MIGPAVTGGAAALLTVGQVLLLCRVLAAPVACISLLPLVLLVMVARAAVSCWGDLLAARTAGRVQNKLRLRLAEHLLRQSPVDLREERTGELVTTTVAGIEALEPYYAQYLPAKVLAMVVPSIILLAVLVMDPLSALVLLLTGPLIPLFMMLIGEAARTQTRKRWRSLGLLGAHFLDVLQGLATLKLLGRSQEQVQVIAEKSEAFRQETMAVLRVAFLSAFALETIATLSTAVIAVEVGMRLLYGRMSFAPALAVLLLAPEFYLPLRLLGQRFHAGMAGSEAAGRIFSLLDQPLLPPVASSPDSRIRLSHVTCAYPGERRPALCDVSLEIEPGTHTAIVGASGSGKTTLAYLLLGFLQPQQGEVHRPSGAISWVPQHPHLFQRTVLENIRLSQPNAGFAEVEEAARQARAEAFIRDLPQGWDTLVGERGARLSAGQVQRIALARALLRQAPIVILDEPTANLDEATAREVQETICKLTSGRTVITIAHRLDAVRGADRIIVLDQGRVAETGTHDELVRQCGHFERLFRNQNKPESVTRKEVQGALVSPRLRVSVSACPAAVVSLRPEQSHCLRAFASTLFVVLLGAATIGTGIGLMATSAWLIAAASHQPPLAALALGIVGVRFFGISRGALRYVERLVSHDVTFRHLARLRVRAYRSLERLAPGILVRHHSGDLQARVVADVETLQFIYFGVLAPILVVVAIITGLGIFTLAFSLPLAVLVIMLMVFSAFAIPPVWGLLAASTGRQAVLRRAQLSQELVDGLQGAADLASSGATGRQVQRLRETGELLVAASTRLLTLGALQTSAGSFLANLTLWGVLVLGAGQVQAGHLNPLYLPMLALAAFAGFEAVQAMPAAFMQRASCHQAARRLQELQETAPEVVSPSQPVHLQPGAGALQVRNLCFRYAAGEPLVLDGVSFDLPPGGRLAVVGPSGSGKSTLLALLLRFWDPEAGDIFVDGIGLRNCDPDEVRRQFAVVGQPTHLFNMSVRENLLLAHPPATDVELHQAARQACIHDVIQSLPHGYDTLIGEQGMQLSGGERQRLAIARALLRTAPFLLLDEPTNHLDTGTELEVMENLLHHATGCSLILCAHQPTGLEHMDQIIRLGS